MKLRIAAAALLVSSSAMAAGSSSSYGNGGWFAEFDPVVHQYNASGELFRIEGHCQSACTLFLGIRNVCIDPGASLLFHAGHDHQHRITAQATSHLMSAYNGPLRGYLKTSHAMETLEFTTISGSDMIGRFGYRKCPAK